MWLRSVSISIFIQLIALVVFAQDSGTIQQFEKLLKEEKYQEIVDLSDSLKSVGSLDQSRIHHIVADARYFLNDVPGALTSYLKALDLLTEKDQDTVLLIELYAHTGFCYKYLGNHLEALPYYQRALEISSAARDELEKSNACYSLGTIYMELSRYEQARQYMDCAYQIDFIRKDTAAIGYDLSNLGDLMIKLQRFDEAIQYYRQALAIKETLANNINTESLRAGKLASAYLYSGQLDSALKYNQLAIFWSSEMGDTLTLAKHWIDQSAIALQSGQTNLAEAKGLQAYQYFKRLGSSQFQIRAGKAVIEAYLNNDRLQSASQLAAELGAVALENGLLEEAAEISLQSSRIFEILGQEKKALDAYKSYQAIQDSLNLQAQMTTSLVLENEYQSARRENELALLKAEDQILKLELQQRRATILALIIALILSMALGSYVYLSQRKRAILKNELLTAEINELRLQIMQLMDYQPDQSSISVDQLNKVLKEPLSEREFEVLQLAMSDKNNGEIAELLFVSTNTVKYHLKNIYQKLGVTNRKEALKFAFQATSG